MGFFWSELKQRLEKMKKNHKRLCLSVMNKQSWISYKENAYLLELSKIAIINR